ncbi:MAG: hypothetical protein K8I30_12360, partial [Anaerolineae bacterium]|nr:hypothetical protein [Anaerolineae bacterium]
MRAYGEYIEVKKSMRRLKRSRLIKIVGVVVVIAFVVVGVVLYLFSSFNSSYILDFVTSQGYVKGHIEYCEHSVTDSRRIRLVFTPYAKPAAEDRQQIDPNNWQDEPGAWDMMPMMEIVIPDIDYEVSFDAGQSWKKFWHYPNQGNEYPWCDSFSSLDADNFWVWARSQIAITHDGGNNWIVQD